MARTTPLVVTVDQRDLEDRMRKIVARAVDAERQRIRRKLQEMPVALMDWRVGRHDPPVLREVLLLADALEATLVDDEQANP